MVKIYLDDLVDSIIEDDLITAKEQFNTLFSSMLHEKLEELKDKIEISEAARIRRIRLRIRNGKVQRNRKVSTVKGYVMRHGRLTRMSAAERRHRKMGARRAKIKRRSERSKIRRHMRQSLRRRHSMGIH